MSPPTILLSASRGYLKNVRFLDYARHDILERRCAYPLAVPFRESGMSGASAERVL